jgi:zinc transporter ZupT
MSLLAAVAALLIGPVLLQLGRFGPRLAGLLDGFTFISIAGLLGFGILPEALAVGGSWAALFAVVGLVFPWALEKQFHRTVPSAHLFIVWLGIAGLAVHALVDGLALASGHADHGHDHGAEHLSLAVILHRLPVGLAVWHLLSPAFGGRFAAVVLALMCGATAVGYGLGPDWFTWLGGNAVACFQAFVAGSILHVIVYEPAHHAAPAAPLERWPDRAGLLIGLALLYVYL